MSAVWTNEKRWEQGWNEREFLGQGGQGITKLVERKSTGEVGCLKVLSKQSDPERRMRFSREATAYDTCKHPLIPRLIASNAQNHANLESKLFLVTEYIPDPTLSGKISSGGVLPSSDAFKLTAELLRILEYLHGNDWVHRDIKPDNIILRNGVILEPVLLDFGLSYKDGIIETIETEHGQEIGNRFLRLPELSVGSTSKRDERSDLAFAGGILFYALTGLLPATLQDADGHMPHQRSAALKIISETFGSATPSVLDFLDRCFNPILLRRHTNAASMRAALETVAMHERKTGASPADDDLAFIKSHLSRDRAVEIQQLSANCMSVYNTIGGVAVSLVTELNGLLVRFLAGTQQRGASVRTNLGFAQPDNYEVRFSPRWEIDVQGSEIVVRSSSGYIFRLDAFDQNVGNNEDLISTLRAHFLKGIRSLIDDPLHQVIHRGFFCATPFPSVAEALNEAARNKKPVFVVVFDEQSPQLSKLDYCLGYFMEYESTKQIVQERFVAALVPASEAKQLVASRKLELAHWFLLRHDGSVLKHQDVYANPDEGLKTVQSLVQFVDQSNR